MLALGAALAGLFAAPAAHAAGSSLTLNASSVRSDKTVAISFDAGAANDRNWVGVYRDGAVPGKTASLDWRYVRQATGQVTWSPSNRTGWTGNAASIGVGEYDVYLLKADGYGVLAGPIDLTVAPAAGSSLTLGASSIRGDQSVSMSFDAGAAVNDRNWVGVYRNGATPRQTRAVDWRYVPQRRGQVSWGPSNRTGWTANAGSVEAGEYDVYVFEADGYGVLAGPIDLTVTAANPSTSPTAPKSSTAPKPEVNGVSSLNVMTFNIWHGGTKVTEGAQQIADVIRESDADVTFFPEVGQAPSDVAARLGYQYLNATDTGIVSRYPIVSTGKVGHWWSKAVIDVNGTEVVVYGGHLEYRWYTTYLPRGYGGSVSGDWPAGWNTWSKLAAPVSDTAAILKANEQSGRPAAATELLADIASERAAGRLAIMGGDFNEPPSQDWTAATANLFDHNGLVIPWQTSQRLLDGGLVDAFRTVHPDPVANPGFTWPADNALFPTSTLTWAPEADERDRIDYIFATPDARLTIDGASVVGPQSSIVRNQRVDDDSADVIFTPKAVWPSDHKAVLAKFSICDVACKR